MIMIQKTTIQKIRRPLLEALYRAVFFVYVHCTPLKKNTEKRPNTFQKRKWEHNENTRPAWEGNNETISLNSLYVSDEHIICTKCSIPSQKGGHHTRWNLKNALSTFVERCWIGETAAMQTRWLITRVVVVTLWLY